MFNDKRRGDVYWFLDTPHREPNTCLLRGDRPAIIVSSDRPAIIVSSDRVNQTSPLVTVIPLTTSQIKLERGDGYCDNVLVTGLGTAGMALTRQIRTVDAGDLLRYLGHLPDREMNRIDAALHRALGL